MCAQCEMWARERLRCFMLARKIALNDLSAYIAYIAYTYHVIYCITKVIVYILMNTRSLAFARIAHIHRLSSNVEVVFSPFSWIFIFSWVFSWESFSRCNYNSQWIERIIVSVIPNERVFDDGDNSIETKKTNRSKRKRQFHRKSRVQPQLEGDTGRKGWHSENSKSLRNWQNHRETKKKLPNWSSTIEESREN